MNAIDNILKNWFGGFPLRRRVTQLFGRRALLETLGARGSAQAFPDALSRELTKAASDDLPAVLVRLSSHEDGLSVPEAAERLERAGRCHPHTSPGWPGSCSPIAC